mgnify:CR=1 FL=1
MKATKAQVKHFQRAVEYQMRKALSELGLLRDQAQSENARRRSLLEQYPGIRDRLHEIARAMNPSYKANDDTPVDEVIVSRVYGSEGGQVDHFWALLAAWMKREFGRSVSRSATVSLMSEVGIRNLAHVPVLPLVLAMHYCKVAVKISVEADS